MRLDALARGEARLSILPGQRDMARFIGDRQRTQLAQMLGDIVGQPVKVQVNLPASPSGGQGDDGHEQAGGAPSAGAISAIQRQQVMALPMVRQLMASFDVSLVEVRRQQDTPPLEGDEAAADTPAGQALADGLDMAMDDTHDLLEDDMDV